MKYQESKYSTIEVCIRKTRLVSTASSNVVGPRPLPPDLGRFDEVTDQLGGAFYNPRGRVFVQNGEPFWVDLRGITDEAAILISVQGVNPRTGGSAYAVLTQRPQNYYVRPTDRWVDGWTVREGVVSQFVFVQANSGLEVADYVLPAGLKGNQISIAVFRPRPPRFEGFETLRGEPGAKGLRGGVGHAGQIQQSHATDWNDLDYWQSAPVTIFTYEIVLAQAPRRPPYRRDDGFIGGTPPAG